ncbi:hypothetical protein J2N86_15040 (plasmid) [Legionella lytica]|uniref:Uncharacterized protein n=1 Tax=Legionella lytica TaxID=96232 RepID=A0ABY4YDD2_9GAMM|nr:hypothetical protein [Legionella lytica]USQ15275.1 hypothetical protein J2N86_15040 [Legionella lytica]
MEIQKQSNYTESTEPPTFIFQHNGDSHFFIKSESTGQSAIEEFPKNTPECKSFKLNRNTYYKVKISTKVKSLLDVI